MNWRKGERRLVKGKRKAQVGSWSSVRLEIGWAEGGRVHLQRKLPSTDRD